MVDLLNQKDFRAVQKLPFCYLCGVAFQPGDSKNRDHLPAECIFAVSDREPLWLPTHTSCNTSHKLIDEKIGQLMGLRRGKVPSQPSNRRLQFALEAWTGLGAVVNVNVDAAIWRWIAGFHAALYGEPGVGMRGALTPPLPRGRTVNGRMVLERPKPQHRVFVETIKSNRLRGNLDRIHANKGKLRYECVWVQADNNGPWMCMFALDIYDWKDLGKTELHPPHGCVGFYTLPSGAVPSSATKGARSSIITPNLDPLDAFSR